MAARTGNNVQEQCPASAASSLVLEIQGREGRMREKANGQLTIRDAEDAAEDEPT